MKILKFILESRELFTTQDYYVPRVGDTLFISVGCGSIIRHRVDDVEVVYTVVGQFASCNAYIHLKEAAVAQTDGAPAS